MVTHFLLFVSTGTKRDLLTLCHQSSPVTKRQLTGYFLSAWTSTCDEPPPASSMVNPPPVIGWPLPSPHPVPSWCFFSTRHGDSVRTGLHSSYYFVHWLAKVNLTIPKAISSNTDGLIFFLTRNLNIYRFQGCPVIFISFSHKSRAATSLTVTDITCLTEYPEPYATD